MTAEELLQIIRRDIGQRLQQELAFSISNNYAANLKGLNAASQSIEKWLDELVADNLRPNTTAHTARSINPNYDYAGRCEILEDKLAAIRDIVK